MPNDTQIVSPATTPAPADYLVPGHAELLLKAVTATFRDNGATGDWLPAVELISDSGHTIALACDPNVKVTAGDDAKVSWFPGVKPGGGGRVGLPSCSCALNIGSGNFAAGTHDLPIATFSTTSPAIFSTPGGGSSQVTIAQDGFYLVSGHLGWGTEQVLDDDLILGVVQDNAGGWTGVLDEVAADATFTPLLNYMHGVTFASMFAGDFISTYIQASSPLTGINGAGLAITQLHPKQLF